MDITEAGGLKHAGCYRTGPCNHFQSPSFVIRTVQRSMHRLLRLVAPAWDQPASATARRSIIDLSGTGNALVNYEHAEGVLHIGRTPRVKKKACWAVRRNSSRETSGAWSYKHEIRHQPEFDRRGASSQRFGPRRAITGGASHVIKRTRATYRASKEQD